MKSIVLEGLAVALAGMLLALLLNWTSPLGIKLGRVYFPAPVPPTSTNAAVSGNSVSTNGLTDGSSAALVVRLAAKGLQVAGTNQVLPLFKNPGYAAGLIVFVDARDDQAFAAGHIPGAYQLDYYRPDKYLPIVLPATGGAETIVVYCNGGECEDSEFTALLLRQSGIAPEKIFVYAGGFSEWAAAGLPVELQTRGSGIMKGHP